MDQSIDESPVIVGDLKSLVDIVVETVVVAADGGSELVDEPVPVGADHADESITLKRKLQAKQAVKELLGPPNPAGKLLGAHVWVTPVASHIRVLHAPIREVGEELHSVGVLGAQEDLALEYVGLPEQELLSFLQKRLITCKLALLPLVAMAHMHRDRARLDLRAAGENGDTPTLELAQRPAIWAHDVRSALRTPPVVKLRGDVARAQELVKHLGRVVEQELAAEDGVAQDRVRVVGVCRPV